MSELRATMCGIWKQLIVYAPATTVAGAGVEGGGIVAEDEAASSWRTVDCTRLLSSSGEIVIADEGPAPPEETATPVVGGVAAAGVVPELDIAPERSIGSQAGQKAYNEKTAGSR